MYLTLEDLRTYWLFHCNPPPLGWCQKPAQDTLRMFDQNPKTDPKTTPYYKVSINMVATKRWWHGAQNAADCVKRTLYLVTLRRSVEKEGIKTAPIVKIESSGRIFVQDGYHRLFCADYVGYKKAIPVNLIYTNPKFKAIENLMLKLGSGKNTYHPIQHPYFRGWNAWRADTPVRFNIILSKLEGAKTILDIGACEGYFSINLAARGCDVTAIELNPDRATVLKYFADLRGVKLSIAVEDWRTFCGREEKEFDATIFLSTFHHQVIQHGLGEFEKLRLIRTKKLFFEMATNREQKMAKFPNLNNNEMVKLVLANTEFTKWEKIYTGPSPFTRDIFAFTR
jgi:2-polyprenyl-3-methyl-5-hydroxy-6-metoxy-1,4-benzoquinol methylase